MTIKSIADIESDAQAAAIATANGRPVHNPHRDKYFEQDQADIWDAAYELSMHDLGCFA